MQPTTPRKKCLPSSTAVIVSLTFCLTFSLAFIFLINTAYSAQAEKAVIDSSGKKIPVTKPFQRIISLYSAHTENICSLGAGKQLIGISRSDDYPSSITALKRYSYREDPEKFIAAQADLVLVRPMIERSYPEFIKKLRQAGISVLSLQPNGVEDMFSYWRNLGILTGKDLQAEEMITIFQSSLKTMKAKLQKVPAKSRPKVYFESIHTKMKTFALDSIGIFVLEQAGGMNVGADASQVRTTNIAFYGKERLLSHGDEIDIFLAQKGRMNPVTREIIQKEPGFQAIRAVREGDIYLIEEALVARPTLRILEGINELHQIFYPSGKLPKQETNE